MPTARKTTALAVALASSFGLGSAAQAQANGTVEALVACVIDGTPCPADPTDVQVDEALSILGERTGESPDQLRQRLQDRLSAAGAPIPGESVGPEARDIDPGAADEAAPVAEEPPAEPAPDDADPAAEQAEGAEEETPEAAEETEEPAPDAAEPAAEADEPVSEPPSEVDVQTDDPSGEVAGEVDEQGTEATVEDALREAQEDDAAEAGPDAGDVPPADAVEPVSEGERADDADTDAATEAATEADGGADAEADVAPEQESEAPPGEDVAAEAPAIPGPDATPQEIAEALSDMPDGEARDELLERLQEGLAEEASAAPATEAEAPDAEELQRRQEMAEEAAAAARASAALAAMEEEAAGTEAVVETETEVVTEETARSSAEDVAAVTEEAADDDRFETLRNILGGAAAGFVIGQLLDSGDEVVARTGDRVIVNRDGEYVVLSDENALLRRPGTTVESQTFEDGSTRTVFRREDGTSVVTIGAPDGRILYRSRIEPDGRRIVLIDERDAEPPVRVESLPEPSRTQVIDYGEAASAEALARALREVETVDRLDRTFSLQQVLQIRGLRELMPRVDLEAITFPTGSAAIQPSQAQELAALGTAMSELIEEHPDELFLVEGHTDTVGGEIANLALSDRRAESVALALAEYFGVPPENMVTQGYGERFLKYPIEGNVRENRRAAVRRITPLIRTARH